ncbi:MAG: ATP-grasp domain-containing protein [Pseudomonadota bacterium]
MTVHILAPDDHVFSLNRLTARIGFLTLGEEVSMFREETFDDIALGENDLVVGGVGYVKRGMRRLGMETPQIDSIPDAISSFAGRSVWHSTMGELRKRVNDGEVIFAKPQPDRLKAFNGRLYSGFRDLISTAHVDDEEPIECSEPLQLLSEHRCYVLRGDPIGLRHYAGDPLMLPDTGVIRAALKAYTDGPMGYAMDFGVTNDGQTVVIEVNDGYAIGAYGLHPVRYANIIQARWDEIRNSYKN